MIAGIPALLVRKVVRNARGYGINAARAARVLKVSRARAREVLQALEAEGFLERQTRKNGDSTVFWEVSMAGNALAMANATRPIHRETADRLLSGLVARAQYLERAPHHFAYFVGELTVFGSYLSDRPRINDIDVGCLLLPRFSDSERQRQFRKDRIKAVIHGGRYFHNISEQLTWPEWEVRLYLKARSPSYSLHELEEERRLIEAGPHRRLYVATKKSLDPELGDQPQPALRRLR